MFSVKPIRISYTLEQKPHISLSTWQQSILVSLKVVTRQVRPFNCDATCSTMWNLMQTSPFCQRFTCDRGKKIHKSNAEKFTYLVFVKKLLITHILQFWTSHFIHIQPKNSQKCPSEAFRGKFSHSIFLQYQHCLEPGSPFLYFFQSVYCSLWLYFVFPGPCILWRRPGAPEPAT